MAFYNTSMDRPITGTTEWARYEIVLNIPTNATGIAYGIGRRAGVGGRLSAQDFRRASPLKSRQLGGDPQLVVQVPGADIVAAEAQRLRRSSGEIAAAE